MVYNEIKIPYPNPYKDRDLMIKEIINGTFAVAIMATLASGQPTSNRYVDFQNNDRFIKNVTQNATDVRSYVSADDGMAYTLDQIKQMAYLPVTIDKYTGGLEYVYYPPFVYDRFEYIDDNGIVLAEFPKSAMDYRGYDLYYLWGDKVGKIFAEVAKDDNGDEYTTGFHLLTVNGEDITLATGLNIKSVVGVYAIKGAGIFIQKIDDNHYRAYIVNVDKKTYTTVDLSDAYQIKTFGSWGLIAFHDRIFDADGNEWKVINETGDDDFTVKTSDWYGSWGDSTLGDGTIIDNVYYLERTHTESYKFVRNIKKKTIKVTIAHSDLGEMTSRVKFGYFKAYNKSYGENVVPNVYHYSYKKYKDFYVTKMPIKYKELKKTKGQWFALSEYGDFMYDAVNDEYYWTWDFTHWFKLTEKDKLAKILNNTTRLWFKKKENDLVGAFGELQLKYNSDTEKAELRAYGIAFYK